MTGVVTGIAAGLLLAGCSSKAGGPAVALPPAAAEGSQAQPVAAGSGAAAGRPRLLVAVTAGSTPTRRWQRPAPGALVVLDPVKGVVTRTLVAAGVAGDAVQLGRDGRDVYFEKVTGCDHEVWKVPVAGGAAVLVASPGGRPALSPDGARLAYMVGIVDAGCVVADDPAPERVPSVQVRDLATGTVRSFPLAPEQRGIPRVVDHVSWNAAGDRLAVSVAPRQDNLDWALQILDPATDRYYQGRTGQRRDAGRLVPATGPGTPVEPFPASLYFREGVFLPDGSLFVVHRCCAGDGGPDLGTPAEALERVDPATGAVIAEVATGRLDRDHTSLDSDATGRWLLYLSGTDLMVSADGARPTTLTSGYQAADW